MVSKALLKSRNTSNTELPLLMGVRALSASNVIASFVNL